MPRALAEPLVLMVAPFAPHIAEELWAGIGHRGRWRTRHSPSSTRRWRLSKWSLPVQINSKARFRVEMHATAQREEIPTAVTGHPEYARWTQDAAGVPARHRAWTDRQHRDQSTGRPAVTRQGHRQGAATEVLIAARCTLLSGMVIRLWRAGSRGLFGALRRG